MEIDAGAVRDVLEELPPTVIRIGWLSDAGWSPQNQELLGSMGVVLQEGGEAVVSVRPVSEAMKVVREGWVVGSVDRALVVTVASPVLFDRAALAGLLRQTITEGWMNPVQELLKAGGRVRVFSPPA